MPRNFDGVDDLISLGEPANLINLGPMTIAAWIYPETAGEGSNGVITRKEGAAGAFRKNFRLDASGAGRIVFNCECGVTDLARLSASSTIPLNAWSFVTLTWDGSATATNSHIYKNGVEVSYQTSTNGGAAASDDTGGNYLIGNNSAGSLTFDGDIAFVHFYNRELAVREIVQIMRYPGSIRKGLLDFRPLINSGDEYDYAGNNPAGTVTGAVQSTRFPPIAGMFNMPRPNLYYPSFSTAGAPTSSTATINRMMMMGVS